MIVCIFNPYYSSVVYYYFFIQFYSSQLYVPNMSEADYFSVASSLYLLPLPNTRALDFKNAAFKVSYKNNDYGCSNFN